MFWKQDGWTKVRIQRGAYEDHVYWVCSECGARITAVNMGARAHSRVKLVSPMRDCPMCNAKCSEVQRR